MIKVAIKNENITSFGGIYHIMDVFSKLGFEKHGWQATDRSGNDFRHARKCQTLRETTFAKRGNAKPFGKRLSPSAEMPNPLRNDLRASRKSLFKGFDACGPPANHSVKGLAFPRMAKVIS